VVPPFFNLRFVFPIGFFISYNFPEHRRRAILSPSPPLLSPAVFFLRVLPSCSLSRNIFLLHLTSTLVGYHQQVGDFFSLIWALLTTKSSLNVLPEIPVVPFRSQIQVTSSLNIWGLYPSDCSRRAFFLSPILYFLSIGFCDATGFSGSLPNPPTPLVALIPE